MAEKIVMPSFGMYTSEGTLVSWNQPNGACVEMGQVVAEIETEKATHELLAPAAGILHHVAQVGALLKEEGLLGYILAEGEQPPEANGVSSSASATKIPASDATPSAAQPVAAPVPGDFIKASPLARRLATQYDIDVAQIKGTGPGGRIVEADVLAAAEKAKAAAVAPAMAATALTADSASPKVRQRVPLSTMRRTIGERLRRSVNTAVSLTLTRDVEADKLVAAREALSNKLGSPIPYDAFFVKLLAAGLRERPELNCIVADDALVMFDDVNIGVAVTVPAGLIVPVIRNADRASIVSVAESIRQLTERARSNALRPADLAGGTSTITNLGGFGVDAFTPILNPPQSSILGIGRIQPRAVVHGNALMLAQTCVLSLTFDHRVTDGVPAAQLLDVVARLMNDEAYLARLA